MNLFRYITPLALLCLICIASCKKKKDDDNNINTEATTAKLTTIINLHAGAGVKYDEVLTATNDSIEALVEMAKWVITQPEVERATLVEGYMVRIFLKNGLKTSISVIPTDENGIHLVRGGGNGNTLSGTSFYKSTDQEHLIGNDRAIVFAPFLSEFYESGSYPHKAKLESGGKHKLKVDVFTDNQATLAVLNTLKDYGLIILNTHGAENSFSVKTQIKYMDVPRKPDGVKITEEELKQLLLTSANIPLESIENGELEFDYMILCSYEDKITIANQCVSVTEKYIRKLPGLTDAVVFGNHCFSGHTFDGAQENNLMEAWKSIGAISYYGYAFNNTKSIPVNNIFAKVMEDSLITNLTNGDSTGIAHLANDISEQDQGAGVFKVMFPEIQVTSELTATQYRMTGLPPLLSAGPFYFKHFIDPRYKYSCGTFTDPRDQEVYELACIGDQQWMAENLRFNAPGSLVYDNDNSKLATYGRLYTYGMVSAGAGIGAETGPGLPGICPNGWHIPNRQDYEKMIAHLNTIAPANKHGLLLKGKTLWQYDSEEEIDDPLRNITGFNAYPGGIGKNATSGLEFFYGGQEAQFWASSLLSTSSIPNTVGIYTLSGTSIAVSPLTLGNDNSYRSCRCVKND